MAGWLSDRRHASAWEDCVATNYDLRAGLMFAGTFHRIHERVPRLEIAMIAQLVNMLGLTQVNGSRLFETAGYLVSVSTSKRRCRSSSAGRWTVRRSTRPCGRTSRSAFSR